MVWTLAVVSRWEIEVSMVARHRLGNVLDVLIRPTSASILATDSLNKGFYYYVITQNYANLREIRRNKEIRK